MTRRRVAFRLVTDLSYTTPALAVRSDLPRKEQRSVMNRAHIFALAAILFCVVVVATASRPTSQQAHMNQIQVLGSHNSYKQRIDPSLLSILKRSGDKRLEDLEYSHIPVEQQLDLGLRALEIDIVYDPEGRRYAHPRGIAVVAENH